MAHGKRLLELLILDANGNMLYDPALAYGCVQAIFSFLNLPAPPPGKYRNGVVAHSPQFYWDHGIPQDINGDQLNVLRRLYYQSRPSEAKYRPDIGDLLRFTYREHDLKTALFSAEIPAVLMQDLYRAGLAMGLSSKGGAQPHTPETLSSISEQMGCRATKAALVSDSLEELESAKKLEMLTILFDTEPFVYYPLGRSRDGFRPDHTVESFSQLAKLLDELMK